MGINLCKKKNFENSSFIGSFRIIHLKKFLTNSKKKKIHIILKIETKQKIDKIKIFLIKKDKIEIKKNNFIKKDNNMDIRKIFYDENLILKKKIKKKNFFSFEKNIYFISFILDLEFDIKENFEIIDDFQNFQSITKFYFNFIINNFYLEKKVFFENFNLLSFSLEKKKEKILKKEQKKNYDINIEIEKKDLFLETKIFFNKKRKKNQKFFIKLELYQYWKIKKSKKKIIKKKFLIKKKKLKILKPINFLEISLKNLILNIYNSEIEVFYKLIFTVTEKYLLFNKNHFFEFDIDIN